MSFELTEDNYYSLESRNAYLSNSDLKIAQECEYKFMKSLRGEYERQKTNALLQGSLLDIMLTGTDRELEQFKKDNSLLFNSKDVVKDMRGLQSRHPELFTRTNNLKGEWSIKKIKENFPDEIVTVFGDMKADFKIVEQMYNKVINDPIAMKYLNGEKQRIFTGNLFGVDMKCKLDIYIPDKAIVDLKSCESIHKTYWSDEFSRRMSFVEYFKYIQQMAIYQELVFQNTGKHLPCYLLAVSKEPITDLELIYIDDETLHDTLFGNEFNQGLVDDITKVRMLKSGDIEPIKCGRCDLCLEEKKIERPIHFTELMGKVN